MFSRLVLNKCCNGVITTNACTRLHGKRLIHNQTTTNNKVSMGWTANSKVIGLVTGAITVSTLLLASTNGNIAKLQPELDSELNESDEVKIGKYLHHLGLDDPNEEDEDTVNAEEKKKEEQPTAEKISSSKKKKKQLKLFTGNSNPVLAEAIAKELGQPLGKATVSRFEDGEVNVRINENVRGHDVYIIQPTCPPNVNEALMELLLMVSTLRRASARRITAVIPYYGYARGDKKLQSRVPISAADIARLLESMGVDRVVAVDLHSGQIQGFFGPRVPVDNLDGGKVGVQYFGKIPDLKNPVVVSPDAGGVYRAKKFREGLAKEFKILAGLAMIIKQRSKPGEVASMDLVGSVEGCDAIIVDDMIDTAGTLCKAAQQLHDNGARKVYAFASHGIFSGPASDRITKSVLEEVIVTDTLPLNANCKNNEKIIVESVSKLLADAIRRINEKKSVSELFS